ncbi:MAG: N-6 DNA methylase, partial [Edaphobacter sp.]
MARPSLGSALSGLTLEGSLLAPAILKNVSDQKASGQSANDYGVPRGVTLRDELSRYFRIGQANYRHLNASSSPSLEATTRFTSDLLTQVLGFPSTIPGDQQEVNGRLYPVTLQALEGRVPVLVVPPAESLDASSVHLRSDGRRRSAATALQDWLNVSEPALWGLCTNGQEIRLLRDNASLTRPAYIEFDLRQIFDNEDFASFTLLWLVLHCSRFGRPGNPISDCPLERWREAGIKTGEVALLHLSGNVQETLLALANGFLDHPANVDLRQRLASGTLALSAATGNGHSFFSQLLRLVYRLIFLLAAEDRDLLHPPETPSQLRELYAEGYSVGSLRDRAVLRAAHSGLEDTFGDRWQGLLLTFRALAHGEPQLGLPALGGLFASSQTPDLDNLALSNRSLYRAMYSLAWLRDGAAPVRVNWRDMQTEELGSVYEGLLELTPRLADTGRAIIFAEGMETKGNERKTSGSYYTPDSLVQTLLDSALDPVLDRMESESSSSNRADPAAHLLTVTVLDPACGSGHFLLAAARRIATRVARLRTGGVASQQDYHRALRDVVRLCIHGVDRNPMAIELSRVALWIETVEPGKPLGFLDANLRCGDSLLGIFSLEALQAGIPDAAYKPLAGDDKSVAKVFSIRNKDDLIGQARLDFSGRPTSLPVPPALASEVLALRSLPEESEGDVAQREQAFERVRANPELTRYELAADLYT